MLLTRKFLALTLILIINALTLSACGGGSASGNFDDDDEEDRENYSNSPLRVDPDTANALVFSWESVPNTDFYRFFANTGNGFEQFGDDIPVNDEERNAPDNVLVLRTLDYPVSVHTFDWTNALFLFESCIYNTDPADISDVTCTIEGYQSARGLSPFAVDILVKPFDEIPDLATFGFSVDVSEDGLIMAVGAPSYSVFRCPDDERILVEGVEPENFCEYSQENQLDEFGEIELDEDDNPILVDGDPIEEFVDGAGAVIIYERSSTEVPFSFVAPVILYAPNRDPFDRFGTDVSFSADSDLLAVSAPGEAGDDSLDPANNDAASSGAVYVFTRGADRDGANLGWDRDPALLKSSNTQASDLFGWKVQLSGDGSLLAASAPQEDSSSDDPLNNSAQCAGAVYIFENQGGGAWAEQAYLKAPVPKKNDVFGQALALNDDGSMLVVGASQFPSTRFLTGCYGNRSPLPEEVIDGMKQGEAYVLSRSGSDWTIEQRLTAKVRDKGDSFGHDVSMTDDGSRILIGAPIESSDSTGFNGDAGNADLFPAAGAAYLFENEGGGWNQTQYIKASNSDATDYFGAKVRISNGGSVMAIGAPGESGKVGGIGGAQNFDSVPGSGATYLFFDRVTGWRQEAFIKGPVPIRDSYFGYDLDFADDQARLVISAPGFRTGNPGVVNIY